MRLTVKQGRREEVYRDIVRIPKCHRLDKSGKVIPEGQVWRIRVGEKCAFVIMRGEQEDTKEIIRMDDVTRNKLDLRCDEPADIEFDHPWWCGYGWALTATEISYRIAAHLALASIVLGLIGLALGIFALCR